MSTTYKTLPSNPQPSKFAPLIHAQMIPHHLCVTTPGSLVQPPNSSQFRHECINLSSHMCSCHHRRYHSLADQTLIHHFLVTFSSPIFKPTSLPRTTRPTHRIQPPTSQPISFKINDPRTHGPHTNLTRHNCRKKNLNSTSSSQFGHKCINSRCHICSFHHRTHNLLADPALIQHFLIKYIILIPKSSS